MVMIMTIIISHPFFQSMHNCSIYSHASGSQTLTLIVNIYNGGPALTLLTNLVAMGFAVRVRSAGQKYGPTCHQRDGADVTEFVTLVRLSSLGQHVGVLALAGYKRRKSALTAGPIPYRLVPH